MWLFNRDLQIFTLINLSKNSRYGPEYNRPKKKQIEISYNYFIVVNNNVLLAIVYNDGGSINIPGYVRQI